MGDGRVLTILGEQVIHESGTFRRVRRYVQGCHPDLGVMVVGWSGGWETVWELAVLRPSRVYAVEDAAR